jgi:2-oxo-3-hexenedioate decarboxylase
MSIDLDFLAANVDEAARLGRAIPQLSLAHPDLSIAHAYAVQRASIARRLARGERVVGMKMGLTSHAKMAQVGVHEPIFGHLTDAMFIKDQGVLDLRDLIHPRIEPEIYFITAAELPEDAHFDTIGAYIAAVGLALEIIDSRYENFKFALPDVIADNASSCRFVLGAPVPFAQARDVLGALPMTMLLDAQPLQRGSSADLLDHPLHSLVALAHMLASTGHSLPAGSIVLAGAATAAEPLRRAGGVKVVCLDAPPLPPVSLHISAGT